MDNNRSSWGSNLGFLLAAIGSAVGLGNIWGFPYKMGKSGGFTFLIVYLLLAIFVGMIIMVSELAVGRKTKLSPIDAYQKVTKKFACHHRAVPDHELLYRARRLLPAVHRAEHDEAELR